MQEYFEYIKDHSSLWLNKVLISVAVFILFYFCARILAYFINRMAKKFTYDKSIVKLIADTVKVTIIIIGIISALGTLGINISALVAGLGLTGFALGFALKDTVSNIVSGILIILYQPFKIGDKIKIAGMEGAVKSIDLRYTKLESESQEIILPNSKMFSDPIIIEKEKD